MGFVLITNLIISSTIMASLMVILIFLVKRVFKNRISAKWHYIIWFVLLLRLAVPYMVYSPLNLSDLLKGVNIESTSVNAGTIQTSLSTSDTSTVNNTDNSKSQNTLNTNNTINSYGKSTEKTKQSFSVNKIIKQFFVSIDKIKINYKLIFSIWILGVLIFSLYAILYNIFFWTRVKNGTVFTDQKIIQLLEECKLKLGVSTNISIIQTSGISIPAIFGVTRPWLLMPEKVLENLNHESLRYVILHEVAHLKRKDILVNWITLLLQIIHWFNPFIWFAFHNMRTDRELACDEVVLLHLDRGEEKKYGHTLLDMVEIVSGRVSYAGIAGVLEDKSQIIDRISMISRFNTGKNKLSILAIIIVVFLGLSIMVNAADFTVDTNKNILAGISADTKNKAPVSIPKSTASATKSQTKGSVTSEPKTNASIINKNKITNNPKAITTSNTNKDKRLIQNHAPAATKENTVEQPQSNTLSEHNSNDISDISGEGVIELSTIYLSLSGTIEKLDEPVNNINLNIDDVVITKVEPNANLQNGIETNITVEVEYNLVSADKAILTICSNVGGYRATSHNAIEISLWEVPKGHGKYKFTIPIIPKKWEDGSPFWVLGKLRKNDGTLIYNRPGVNLGIK